MGLSDQVEIHETRFDIKAYKTHVAEIFLMALRTQIIYNCEAKMEW